MQIDIVMPCHHVVIILPSLGITEGGCITGSWGWDGRPHRPAYLAIWHQHRDGSELPTAISQVPQIPIPATLHPSRSAWHNGPKPAHSYGPPPHTHTPPYTHSTTALALALCTSYLLLHLPFYPRCALRADHVHRGCTTITPTLDFS